MGLDMYMNVKEIKTGKSIKDLYWRKFNALHGYIDDLYNVDDERRSVSLGGDDIRDLVERFTTIKNNIPKVKEKHGEDDDGFEYIEFEDITGEQEKVYDRVLPYCEGFFFGTYDYDDYYLSCVLYTLKEFEKLKEYWDTADFIYEASR